MESFEIKTVWFSICDCSSYANRVANLLKIPSAVLVPYLPSHIWTHWHWGSAFGNLKAVVAHHACAPVALLSFMMTDNRKDTF